MQSNNDITMLKITRRAGEAFFIDDICIRIELINLNVINLLIDDVMSSTKIGEPLALAENIKLILTKKISGQIGVQIFAPRSVLIAREEIAAFDKNGKLLGRAS